MDLLTRERQDSAASRDREVQGVFPDPSLLTANQQMKVDLDSSRMERSLRQGKTHSWKQERPPTRTSGAHPPPLAAEPAQQPQPSLPPPSLSLSQAHPPPLPKELESEPPPLRSRSPTRPCRLTSCSIQYPALYTPSGASGGVHGISHSPTPQESRAPT